MDEERHYMRTKQAILAVKTLNEEFATLKRELDVALEEVEPKLNNGSIYTEIRYNSNYKDVALIIDIRYSDSGGCFDKHTLSIKRDGICIDIETNTTNAENISTLVEFCKTRILGE